MLKNNILRPEGLTFLSYTQILFLVKLLSDYYLFCYVL